jgi:hypothetical protein
MVTLVSLLLNPFLPMFAGKDGYLPRWLWWFQTPDAPLDGDVYYLAEHARFKGENITWWQRYYNRVMWLYRNTAYGFDWTVLAFKPQPGYVVELRGNRPLSGDLKHDGWFYAKATNPDGSSAWQLYVTHHWTAEKSTKINLGWKIWSAPDACMFVFSPSGVWKAIKQ